MPNADGYLIKIAPPVEEENLTTASKAWVGTEHNFGLNTSVGGITEKQFTAQIGNNDEAVLIH